MDLTEQQQSVVDADDKKILVLSCAGSGKTTVISLRIARLWDIGVQPEEILALTFSNKASQEMKKRICKENAKLGAKVNVRTFHSFGLDIIRRFNLAIGYDGPIKIARNSDCKAILREILKRKGKLELVGDEIEGYLKEGKSCEPYDHVELYDEIFEEYNATLLKRNMVDMDDMIWIPVNFLKRNESVRKIISSKYKYIFVDEYQDTNEAQNRLLDLIINKDTNICLVGDDDQAIYEWRGARPKYIREKAESGEYIVIRLETNFRSQQGIIDAANSIINNNKNRVDKKISADRPQGVKTVYKRLNSQEEEASYIAEKIKELLDEEKYNASDIAVLCRVNKQLDYIKDALDEYEIAYDACEIDDNGLYSHFVNVLQAIVDIDSLIDVGNALNFPDMCFDNFIYNDAKSAYCDEYGQDLAFDDMEWLYKIYASDITFENCDSFRERFGLISKLHAVDTWTPTQVVALYIKYMQEKKYDEKFEEEYHFVLQVFDIAKNYEEAYGEVTLKEFIYHLTLTMGIGDTAKGTDYDAVNILTMHRSKGLEFKVVFIIGVQVGVIPNDYFIHYEDDLEAERRLFYVAITRAKELLFFTSYRDPFGGSFKSSIITHGFMAEIPKVAFCSEEEYIKRINMLPRREEKKVISYSDSSVDEVLRGKIEIYSGDESDNEYEAMVDVLDKDVNLNKSKKSKAKPKKSNSFVLNKYIDTNIEELSLNEDSELFKCISLENVPEEFSILSSEISDKINDLSITLKKYPDEVQLSRKFLEIYIPELIRLVFSYLEYDKTIVSTEILNPIYTEIIKSMNDLKEAISIRIDEIYTISTLDTKAKAIMLQRIIAQDGYSN